MERACYVRNQSITVGKLVNIIPDIVFKLSLLKLEETKPVWTRAVYKFQVIKDTSVQLAAGELFSNEEHLHAKNNMACNKDFFPQMISSLDGK